MWTPLHWLPLLPLLGTAFRGIGTLAAAADFEVPTGSREIVIDLSGRDLGESARLVVVSTSPSSLPSESTARIALRLLNVSGNPRLRRILVDGSLQVMQIDTLDLSGTSITPTKELIAFNPPQDVLLSIRQVFINETARPQPPLAFAAFTDLLYRLRTQSFVLDGWSVADFAANFSQADNACQSKKFDSVSVRSAGLRRLAGASISATQRVDFSRNEIREAVNVDFYSASVDLSQNRLSRLAGVSFKPGAFCRTLVTGPPEVRLSDNALTEAALMDAIGSSPSQSLLLRSLDLSRNPLLTLMPTTLPIAKSNDKPDQRIRVVEWLRLDGVIDHEVESASAGVKHNADVTGELAALSLGSFLRRLFHPPGASTTSMEAAAAAAGGPTSLDLSGNRLGSLAATSRVLAAWTSGQAISGRLAELRLANWTLRTDHLNLSELEPEIRPSRWLDLGDLTGSDVLSLSVVVGDADVDVSFAGMQAAWRVEVRLQPVPASCCRAQGSGGRLLFCFVRPEAHPEYRRLICGGDGTVSTTTQPRSPPALILALAALAASLAVLLVVVAIVGGIRRRRKRQSRRLPPQRRSPQRELPVEVTAMRLVES